MEYSIEALSDVEKKITVSVPAQKVNATLDALVSQRQKEVELDGFRKGKVPARIVEERFGIEIRSRATEQLMKEQISSILDKENLNPVSTFTFEAESCFDIGRGRAFTFSCSVEVLPPVDLPDFSTCSIEVDDVEVRKSSLVRRTRNMLRRFGKLEKVSEKRCPQNGDIVLVAIRAYAGAAAFIGLDSPRKYVQINAGELPPEIERVLCALEAGDDGKGEFVCPDDYVDPDLRGKPVCFTVHLHEIFTEHLPDIDDELAGKLGQKDAKALRKYIFEQELNAELKRIKAKAQERLLKSILDSLDFTLPQSMLKKEVGAYMVATRNMLTGGGMSQSDTERVLEHIRSEAEASAQYQVKAQCFLMTVGYKENIKVYQRDAELAIRNMARESHQDYEKLREHLLKSGAINDLQERLMAAKALDFIYDKAHKIVVDKNGNPLPSPVSGENPASLS